MKRLIIAISLVVATMQANAAPPSEASIKTLFEVMKADKVIDGLYASIEPMMHNSITQAVGQPANDEQRKILKLMPARLSKFLRQELTWARMEPIQIKIYRETFEQEEIDGLIDFYRSPAGKAYVDKMPLVAQRAMVETQSLMGPLMPKIQAEIEAVLREVRDASNK